MDALELKSLMSVLDNAMKLQIPIHETSDFLKLEGYHLTAQNVESFIQAGILITRNLCSQINNKPDEDDAPPVPIAPTRAM